MRKILRILIVDDDPSTRYILEKILSKRGYNIIGTARDGDEAIETFINLSQKPDAILMDYQMPSKNGIEATKEILKIDENAKIIIISADSSIKNEALSAGAICFSEKIVPSEKMIENIEMCLYKAKRSLFS